MKGSFVTLLILQLNSAIDSGKYNDITIDEVHDAIYQKKLLKFLKQSCGKDIDLSLHLDEHFRFEEDYEKRMNDLYSVYVGNESRKWGIKNSGLCLVLAWTCEIIQAHFTHNDDPNYRLAH
ncbi:hypothetical protein [Xenorhabdus bovienii]|uniref:hypothetical protein n=1 Tax=Xenorhabdus bovienii TaxID=40576 RepID=UPI0023B2F42A|nr:hypothetical protein [Xenorhabdus bovienii]MDE9462339.1 hypothetical protein [Xenorhabdus bovienii]MDE9469161.1 hypothetical protein [Xenorhabdus bovienii]MDE9517733.1 hypothetical protein [Xenorhabdus bovienii]